MPASGQPVLPELAGAAALGSLLSIAASVVRTPNPARIPVRQLAFRSAFGLTIWWVVSTVLASGIVWLGNSVGTVHLLAALALGSVVSQIGGIKDLLIPHSVAIRVPRLFRALQTLDDITHLYLKRIIAREERKLNHEFFDVDEVLELPRRQEAVRRLFEFHQVEIALGRRRHLRAWEADKVLIAFNLGDMHRDLGRLQERDVKFKLLLRFLGCKETIEALEALTRQPDLLRLGQDRQIIRTLESPYVRDYVLQREIRL